MTFRTPEEAVMLANNSRYGLAASVWSETIGLALDIAPKLQCGVVWVNATNLFDAGVGFGGYRESGFGREGGREGIYEYLKPKAWAARKPRAASAARLEANSRSRFRRAAVDRTAKLFIGGKQARPDGNYSRAVAVAHRAIVGEVGEGNRKDIRNAVAAARARRRLVEGDGAQPRADPLLHRREPVGARRRVCRRIARDDRRIAGEGDGRKLKPSIARLFTYGAWADKYEGAVHASAACAAWRWR